MASMESIRHTRVQVVVFDAFGTLLQFGRRLRPYHQLAAIPRSSEAQFAGQALNAMTVDLEFSAFAAATRPDVGADMLADLDRDLRFELAEISLFPDVLPMIRWLRGAGIRIGVCSNLAKPYGVPLRNLLPAMDFYALSYEQGAAKPDPRIYQYCVQQLDLPPESILFVGDTPAADVQGPRASGLQAILLDRGGHSDDAVSLSSLEQLSALLSPGQ